MKTDICAVNAKIAIIVHPVTETIKHFSNYNDAELIELWQRGDDHAFEFLYKKYVVKLLSIAVQKTDDRAFAEEIVHDAFLDLHINKHNLPVINSISAYLYVIIKRKLLDFYRHQQVKKKHAFYVSSQTRNYIHNPVSDQLETREFERLLDQEINKIPLQSRTVFLMRRTQDLSNKKIAAELKISENTVEQHMRKALKMLRLAFHTEINLLLLFIFFCS